MEILTNNNPGTITEVQMKAVTVMLKMLGIYVEGVLFHNLSFDEAVTFIKALKDKPYEKI